MVKALILMGSLCLFLTLPIFAHGDVHEQIEKTSKRIEKQPNNANLYLKRGQLYATHKEFENAKEDYKKAKFLNADLEVIDLLLAKTYAANNQAHEALQYVNTFLKNQPNNPNGLITRAGIFQQLNDDLGVKRDLELAFDNIDNPTPTHYVNIAEAHRSDFEVALYWLKKGQARFGFDIVLKEKEIEILVGNEAYHRALLSVNEILEYLPRKEKWLFQKGQICEKANENEAALASYNAALMSIQDLPRRIQGTRKMMELEARTLEKLASLE